MARRYPSRQARALVALLALSATTACAGEVGKYRDAAVAPIPGEAGGTTTGADAGAAAASASAMASDTAVPTTVALGPPASPGQAAVTVTSGPVARASGQSTAAGQVPTGCRGWHIPGFRTGGTDDRRGRPEQHPAPRRRGRAAARPRLRPLHYPAGGRLSA